MKNEEFIKNKEYYVTTFSKIIKFIKSLLQKSQSIVYPTLVKMISKK